MLVLLYTEMEDYLGSNLTQCCHRVAILGRGTHMSLPKCSGWTHPYKQQGHTCNQAVTGVQEVIDAQSNTETHAVAVTVLVNNLANR